ncbi:HupE/UreJ family protein [Adhaeribacter radiodurans]|uniref:HupE/UreJ family protein n=1 Tax=Adhaeribacter radiodurans TaxID=2745197 RepID=A0A7L7L882_9BACT|nr:HupE/UreJ family protein [Adhaeribacter radiodurans]QMU28599.1 HupE/UreJ family protein [Adhaeribacter radiodurans]
MQDFSLYFALGWEHILDWQGYDHILFVCALCGVYALPDWRKVFVLVTAFTLGHSVTLALSVLNKIKVPTELVEFLIPVTIVFTCLSNILRKKKSAALIRFNYLMAMLFGLIHGLGFSNYLKSLLGRNSNILAELFSFNLGLEMGQIIIVLTILFLSFIFTEIVKTPRREWNLFLSSAIFGVAFTMAIERLANLMQ